MATSLLMLLDDIASVLDDVATMTKVAAKQTAGVLGDDLALNAKQVTGVDPTRELAVVWAVAKGSAVNKAILVPAALLISWLVPWAIPPLLIVGGAFLCYEGAEKILHALAHRGAHGGGHDAVHPPAATGGETERTKIGGAIRTDFILSAEIMAIALSEVSANPILTQAITLAIVAIAITAGVYGVVALIVKADDVGLHLAKRDAALARAIGRGLVKGVPVVMRALAVIGTAAMIWVGGGILVHGMETLGFAGPAHMIHDLAEGAAHPTGALSGVVAWIITAIGSGIVGLVAGGILALLVHQIAKMRGRH